MSILVGNPFLLNTTAATGYQVSRSLRFNSADSAYLNRTPASAGNRRTFTFSCWLKRCKFDETHSLLRASDTYLQIYSTDNQIYSNLRGGATNYFISYAAVLRDPSQWYHIVWAVDTTQATASNRQKVYLNGVELTTAGSLGQSYPPQNELLSINDVVSHTISGTSYLNGYLAECHFIDGSAKVPGDFAETDATTGQWIPKAYTGSYGTNGFWLKFSNNATAAALGTDYSGNNNTWTVNNLSAYDVSGRNYSSTITNLGMAGWGSRSRMFDGSLVTFAQVDNDGIGYGGFSFNSPSITGAIRIYAKGDTSLRINGSFSYSLPGFGAGAWISISQTTVSSIEGAATGGGGAYIAAIEVNGVILQDPTQGDALVDTPTSYGTDDGLGGSVRGNYCTLNPLDKNTLTLANGNLQVTGATTNQSVRGTIFVSSGKWYYEATITNIGTDAYVGFASNSYAFGGGSGRAVWRGQSTGGILEKLDGTNTTSVGQYTTGDVIGCAIDFVNDRIDWYKNNTLTVSYTSAGLSSYAPLAPLLQGGGGSYEVNVNFGQRAFAYTAPSGFKALCDTNLTAPVVAKPSTVMDVLLYTGNGTNGQAITGLNFSPEFVWIKKRSAAAGHGLWDVIRGASNTLSTVNTQTEAVNSVYGKLQSFDGNGFTVTAGTDPSDPRDIVNVNGATYVAWAWDAGTSTVTNTQGSITSSVRTNASAGFSIVTYTGTGSNATVGHGLGAGVGMLIIKNRNSANEWVVGHTGITLGSGRLYLNTTDANDTAGASALWNSTAATSSVFSVGTNSKVNSSGGTYVAYVFSPVSGYSSFGSYVGNNNPNGPFVYTGFRPRFILIKNISEVKNWLIYDTARDPYNVGQSYLAPNLSNAEATITTSVDILSNGFKLRYDDGSFNGTGTQIYAAFAESPFQYARAR